MSKAKIKEFIELIQNYQGIINREIINDDDGALIIWNLMNELEQKLEDNLS